MALRSKPSKSASTTPPRNVAVPAEAPARGRGRARWHTRFEDALILFLLWNAAVYAFGGYRTLWAYSSHGAHRATARALWEGHLYFPFNLALGYAPDLQTHNGAVYTQWNYGIAFLQLPFHVVWNFLFPQTGRFHFFPDRFVFFLFLSIVLAFFFRGVKRLVVSFQEAIPPSLAQMAAFSFTFASFAYAVFPLTSLRFVVYEETIAYFILAEFGVLALYLHWLTESSERKRQGWLFAAGMLSAFALFIRPTAMMYALGWAVVFLSDAPTRRNFARFAAGFLPLFLVWALVNRARTDSFWSLGFENSSIYSNYSQQMLMGRFGSPCRADLGRLWDMAGSLFRVLFIDSPVLSPRMTACKFTVETGLNLVPPFLGPGVLLVDVVGLGFAIRGAVRRRRLSLFAPYLVAGLVFAGYVFAGYGFIYRYVGDFTPLVVLALAQWFWFGSPGLRRRGGLIGLSLAALGFGIWEMVYTVAPQRSSVNYVEDLKNRDLGWLNWYSFLNESLWHEYQAPRLPSRMDCGAAADTSRMPGGGIIPMQGFGWRSDCAVDSFTNVVLGLPEESAPQGHYRLQLTVDHPLARAPKVFFNGRVYSSFMKSGDYVADVEVDPDRLLTPQLMCTIEWTHGFSDPGVRLFEVAIAPR